MDKRAWHASLPKKRQAAGGLLANAQGAYLLVKPTYKSGWDIPGGVVEAHESPRAACVRELREEIGLQKTPLHLAVVDYLPTTTTRLEGIQFIFWCGVLSETEIAQIVLQAEELRDYRFVALDKLDHYLNAAKTQRITVAHRMIHQQRTAYLESGES